MINSTQPHLDFDLTVESCDDVTLQQGVNVITAVVEGKLNALSNAVCEALHKVQDETAKGDSDIRLLIKKTESDLKSDLTKLTDEVSNLPKDVGLTLEQEKVILDKAQVLIDNTLAALQAELDAKIDLFNQLEGLDIAGIQAKINLINTTDILGQLATVLTKQAEQLTAISNLQNDLTETKQGLFTKQDAVCLVKAYSEALGASLASISEKWNVDLLSCVSAYKSPMAFDYVTPVSGE